MLFREYSSDDIHAAVELSLETKLSSSQGVKHILLYATNPDKRPAPLKNWPTTITPDISIYGQLGGVE